MFSDVHAAEQGSWLRSVLMTRLESMTVDMHLPLASVVGGTETEHGGGLVLAAGEPASAVE